MCECVCARACACVYVCLRVCLSAMAYTNHPDLMKRKDSAGSDDGHMPGTLSAVIYFAQALA